MLMVNLLRMDPVLVPPSSLTESFFTMTPSLSDVVWNLTGITKGTYLHAVLARLQFHVESQKSRNICYENSIAS